MKKILGSFFFRFTRFIHIFPRLKTKMSLSEIKFNHCFATNGMEKKAIKSEGIWILITFVLAY